jgi:hypothetical protein
MTDSRPRNNQGQFAPESEGGIDANTTSTAYNPQIIEARKASLIEKIRRMRGARNGVEESVPQREQVLCAKLRLRELARVAQPYPEEERKSGVGKLGALGLGLGLGIGGGVAGVRYLRPVLAKAANRAARNVTKGAKDVSDAAKKAIPEATEVVKRTAAEAAGAVKQTAADAQDAMAIGKDLGKAYNKAKSSSFGDQLKRGAWNITNPRKYLKEIYGEFKAGVKDGQAVKAKMANVPASPKAQKEWRQRIWAAQERSENPYKAARPEWADKPGRFFLSRRLQKLVEFSNGLVEFEEDRRSNAGVLAGLAAAGVGALALPTALPALRNLRRIKKTTGAKGMEDRAGFVADYLRMASRAGRTPGLEQFVGGFKGQWTTRRALQGRGRLPFQKLSPDQAAGAHFSGNHNQKFTMGPKMAHDHWDWEVMSRFDGKKAGRDRAAVAQAVKKHGIDPKTFKPDGMTSMYADVPVPKDTLRRKVLSGRKAAHKHIGDRISKGDTYEDAVASLKGRSSNVDEYLGALMRDKAGVAQGYGKAAMAAPALLVGGAGVAGVSAQRKEKK